MLQFLFTASAIAQEMHVIRDEEIEQTLKTFLKPVLEQAGLSPESVHIILLQDDSLNAFVAGGQNIFVHTGLLLRTDNPEEIIGVLSHETGHIAEGHLVRLKEEMENVSTEALIAKILGVAAAIGTGSGGVFSAANSASDAIALRAMLSHTRTQESSADQAGVSFLKEAHLPLTGFLSFMQKMEREELLPESQQSAYMRTHPLSQDRVFFLQDAVATSPKNTAVPQEWVGMHQRMKAKLLGFLYPDRALLDKGTSIDSRYARAIATYRKGKTKEAIALLDPLISEEPDNAYFYELKGQILFETGQVNDALPAYQRAVTFAPKSSLIRTAYGHALLEAKMKDKAKQLKDAVEQLNLSLETEERQSFAHHLLAIAYGQLGEEGLSRLHLAEEAALAGNFSAVMIEAKLAQKNLPANSPSWLQAQDLLNLADQKLKESAESSKRRRK